MAYPANALSVTTWVTCRCFLRYYKYSISRSVVGEKHTCPPSVGLCISLTFLPDLEKCASS